MAASPRVLLACLQIYFYFAFFVKSSPCAIGFDSDKKTCEKCSYDQYREHPLTDPPFPVTDCLQKNKTHNLSLSIWISDKPCDEAALCDGSLDSPFDNILIAMIAAEQKAKKYLF